MTKSKIEYRTPKVDSSTATTGSYSIHTHGPKRKVDCVVRGTHDMYSTNPGYRTPHTSDLPTRHEQEGRFTEG